MTNYFDNNKCEFKVGDGKVEVVVDHGNHYHVLDISNATLEDMQNSPGTVMGAAHSASPHYKKE